MLNLRPYFALALAAAFFSAGCHSQPSDSAIVLPGPSAQSPAAPLPPGNADQAARANNKFTWALWDKSAPKGNAFISPVSISQALSMPAAGSQGPTADELWQALGFTPSDNKLADQATLINALAKAQDANVSLQSANALWVSKNDSLKPDYAQQMVTLFSARAESLDFSLAAKAAGTINAWVESKTNSKIKNLVPASALNAQTRLVITNAVYFKANWATQFKAESTSKAPFKTAAGPEKPVDTMHAQLHIAYAEDDAFQFIELPYKGNRIALRVFLPTKTTPLDAARASALVEAAKNQPVLISLPKFKIEWSAELSPALKALGVKHAFENADFTPMFASRVNLPTAISAILHKTFVQVDETGTEAAAATAVIVGATAMPIAPKSFNADHPFLFQIVDKDTDTILFMGQLADPS